MKVRSIELRNAFSHADTTVQLPERGLVLVTGANGSGKSSLVEAVSVAGWDTTLRGTPAWQGKAGFVSVAATDAVGLLEIVRMQKGKSRALMFNRGGGVPVKYETQTKAQTALEQLIGPHDLWRRTHVFSSQDAAHFTMAKDSERKRFIEVVAGLDRFDDAGKRAAALALDAKKVLALAESARVLAQQAVTATQDRLKDSDFRLNQLPEPTEAEDYSAMAEAAMTRTAEIRTKRYDISKEIDAVAEALSDHRATARQAEAYLAKLSRGECGECGQAISDTLIKRAKKAAATANTAAPVVPPEWKVELAALQAESDTLLERLGMWRGAAKEAAQNAQQRAQLVKARQALLGKLEDAQDAQDASNEALASARVAAGVAVAGAKVLSVGGVRSHLLIAALTGLESVANRWLEQIVGSGLSLRLAPYAEKADGGVKDAIAIEIDGAGNGYGYKATSGGERRRIDVALLLAMMEVAGTLYGGDDGTLFFDEVFDALDEDGVEGVCSALESLSEERCVMVITHNKVLESRLKRVASARFNVDAGRVAP